MSVVRVQVGNRVTDARSRTRGEFTEMKRKFSKIKIISGPFQPLRKLQLDEGSPNLPSPPPSLRNRAICNPPVNRPVAELHASASLEVRPPCIFSSQAGLKRKPSNQVSATPPKSAALDSQPNSKRSIGVSYPRPS